jgi:xanthine dehydrogenase large subunit
VTPPRHWPPRRLSGELRVGGQEHFYMESQIAMAIPGEDGELTVHSSTQIPTDVQHITARLLGCDYKSVTVTTRRMGGAFGGKTGDALSVAAAAALAARRTGRPVKMRLSRKVDLTTTGKRHAWLYRWTAGFDTTGRLLALDATMVADAGRSRGLTGDVVHKAILHALNCYNVPAVCVRALACKTNTVSNVACRGFGASEGMLLMEDVVHRVAKALGLSPEEVRERNFAGGENDAETPYGQALEGDLIRRVWAEARRDSDWDARRLEIAVVFLQRAGKYQRPAWLLSQGQKVLYERVIMASQCPSHPW